MLLLVLLLVLAFLVLASSLPAYGLVRLLVPSGFQLLASSFQSGLASGFQSRLAFLDPSVFGDIDLGGKCYGG